MTKRYGHLITKIVERPNLDRAFNEVVDQLRDPKRARYRGRREEIIKKLTTDIANGTFRVKGYREMLVIDGPKERLVQSPCVTDRIGCNAIMRIVEDVVYPSVIKTSAASIPGRGMHHLFQKIRSDIENNRNETRYFYKCDIRKFFESIDQGTMWQCVKRYIKDPTLLPILQSFITMMPKGLSIGLRSSQCFGNIIVNDIDHYFKDVLGIKYYYRYCDDIVILGSSKQKLWILRDIMHYQVAKLGLHIKPNEVVKPLSSGLDFLGFIYDGEKAKLRKRTKQKAARKLAKVKSRRRRQEIIGSLKGMAKWGDCRHLYKLLTHNKTMIDCGDILSEAIYEDGKKRFKGSEISAKELINKPFIVVDFERDVIPRREITRYNQECKDAGGNTSQVEPPKKKYLISILYNGFPRKIWTGLAENKAKLEKALEEGTLPFFASISADFSGRFPCYTLCSATALGFQIPSDSEVEGPLKKFNMK